MAPTTIAASDQPVCTGDEPRDDDLHLPIPAVWDGACLDVPAIAEADVASLSASTTRVAACEPNFGPVPSTGDFSWDFHAMACANEDGPRVCQDEVQWCAPRAEGDFHQCVYTRGDEPTCPAGYPKRRVFFEGIDGSLACSSCTCEGPSVSACRADLFGFSDPGCNDVVVELTSELGPTRCNDQVSPGGLRSLSLSWTVNEPGACTPRGGSPTGRVTADTPTTFCCL
ncbi:hypothetical protein [Chondromyces crocatus]|nr:hypothetical protein [Chondromyces crocatus]